MEYSALMKDPRLQPLLTRGFGNECGRLFQGIRDIPGTDTCFFIELKNIPEDRNIVNTSGKAGSQIPQLPLGDNSSPGGDISVCVYPHKVYTSESDKSLTATYQCKTPIPSNKLLVTNILTNN
jgi:hypothetical protein